MLRGTIVLPPAPVDFVGLDADDVDVLEEVLAFEVVLVLVVEELEVLEDRDEEELPTRISYALSLTAYRGAVM